MEKKYFILPAVLLCLNSYSQIFIDKPIVLEGNQTTDRQIENLSEPTSLNNISTAASIQKNSGRFGLAVGIDSLTILISSGIQFYSPGNIIYFQASSNNTGPAKLSVNSLPFFPLKVYGSEELKSNQLKPGQIYCAIFSGAEFQLLSDISRGCRTDFVEVNSTYCIEKNERTAIDLWQAMQICNNNNARLCKWGEWYYACQKGGIGVTNMANNYEWTDDAANSTVRVAGNGSCTALVDSSPTLTRPYRCCYSK
jgi:hypothetical protein